jgi:exodeoxyribonuclease V alpha subunit
LLAGKIKTLFPAKSGSEVDWQSVAAFAAAQKKFCVISGGPGTGKTHTLVLILALLLELDATRKLRIAVAAPTGKAAARIQESIRQIKSALNCGEDIKAQLPEDATTIHRLLGYRPDSTSFRHNAENPLPFDVVAVDEASMADLALMAKLFQAIPPNARVILLGDKDQLASVEAGAVLGDICAAAGENKNSPLAPCVVQLKKNHRFGADSAIFHLSHAINEGDPEKVFQILRSSGAKAKADLVAAVLPERAKLKAALKDKVIAGFGDFLKAADPLAAIAALSRFRVLCALREGPFGVAGLNRVIGEILDEAGLIRRAEIFYDRRPVMVTQNDYHLKLFNGDIGVIWHDASGSRACFAGADQSLRTFLPLRLPAHETAYAMTVHKSQGSEFDRVLLLLPDKPSPILTRELLYTGITRARCGVELWFDEAVFRAACAQRVRRNSGLHAALA